MNRHSPYSDGLRPVSRLEIGSSAYWVLGTPEALEPLLRSFGIAYDSIEPSPINPHNGVLRMWKIGELAEALKERGQ